MATITPQLARDLMVEAMVTGNLSVFDKYGGQDPVQKIYEASGGKYDPFSEVSSQAELKRLANIVATTGRGKFEVLKMTNTPLTQEGVKQGRILESSLPLYESQGIPISSGVKGYSWEDAYPTLRTPPAPTATLTPEIARELMVRAMVTGAPQSEFDKYGGYDAVEAMYRARGGKYDPMTEVSSPAELQRLANIVAQTGSGNWGVVYETKTPVPESTFLNANESIRKDLEQKGVPIIQTPPEDGPPSTPPPTSGSFAGIPALSKRQSIIPQFNKESSYAGSPNFYGAAPNFAPIDRAPTPPMTPADLPALIQQAMARPQLNAPVQYIDSMGAPASGVTSLAEGGNVQSNLQFTPTELGSTFDVSEYINPETGRFFVNEMQRNVVFNPALREAEARERALMAADPEYAQRSAESAANQRIRDMLAYRYRIRPDQPYRMAEGGLASLGENLAAQGRGGDSMMVHMAPEEVAGLRALAMQQGTDLTINPQTGMPEAFKLKKLFRALAPMLPFVLPFTAPFSLAMKAGLSGLIGGFTAPGKGFNFKEGLKTGIMAFAGGKLAEGLQAAGQAAGTTSTTVTDPSRLAINPSAGQVDLANTGLGPQSLQAPDLYAAGQMAPAMDLSQVPSTAAPMPPTAPSLVETPTMAGVQEAGRGVSNIVTGAPGASTAFTEAVGVAPTTAALIGTAGYGMLEGDKEREEFKTAQAAQQREEEKRRQEYLALFRRTLGAVPMPTYGAAGGGLVAMAQGGMPTFEYGGTTAPTGEPRMVQGAGDGMSDNVPASIEGVQEARLANDEFVIPADVVADIGNGSSSSGAKKLYAMMDRIRQARHGTNEQPPEIDAERLMPA